MKQDTAVIKRAGTTLLNVGKQWKCSNLPNNDRIRTKLDAPTHYRWIFEYYIRIQAFHGGNPIKHPHHPLQLQQEGASVAGTPRAHVLNHSHHSITSSFVGKGSVIHFTSRRARTTLQFEGQTLNCSVWIIDTVFWKNKEMRCLYN